jgi:hypothetical protein
LRNQRKPKESSKALRLPRLRKNPRLTAMVQALNSFLRGWHWYFKGVWSPWPDSSFDSFDGFVRRRVRSALCGRTGSGWWHTVLTNAVLHQVGLVSLDELQAAWHRAALTAPVRKDGLGGEPYAGKPHVRFGAAGRG